ncbi:Hypothetical predicted protein [Octopus vulgaris]|uniref:Uncharacterized protein n=1 Tax=Octopus vulgaris TaxID=6645 RepID=A0AA36EXY9_OCTVU|nr:Hypothetical predicted protein [Octopus vulgaris]
MKASQKHLIEDKKDKIIATSRWEPANLTAKQEMHYLIHTAALQVSPPPEHHNKHTSIDLTVTYFSTPFGIRSNIRRSLIPFGKYSCLCTLSLIKKPTPDSLFSASDLPPLTGGKSGSFVSKNRIINAILRSSCFV